MTVRCCLTLSSGGKGTRVAPPGGPAASPRDRNALHGGASRAHFTRPSGERAGARRAGFTGNAGPKPIAGKITA
jgi:hypothetical protein